MSIGSQNPRNHRLTGRAIGSFAGLMGLLLLSGATCENKPRAHVVASGLAAPMYVTTPAGDNSRKFIVERAGTVRILTNGSVLPAAFFDITSKVGMVGEGGLLSIAFSPNYASDGEFYAFYSNTLGASVLSRFLRSSTDPNLADPSSEKVLLTLQPPTANHKGGTIAFSPIDGYLYIGIGDGGSSPNARDVTVLFGKMLRLDVSGGPTAAYTIPPTNPFAGPDGVRDEIWSIGFRNPFRWSFDRLTGDLWIADVGAALREEIDYEPAGQGGGNYGWPTHEGTVCLYPTGAAPCDDPQNPVLYTFPVYEYTHAEGCSITGSAFSRGPAPSLYGKYLFTDLCSGHIWALVDGVRVELDATLGVGALGSVVALSEDAIGVIYLSQISTGNVYRID